jgi:hypothetical protein
MHTLANTMSRSRREAGFSTYALARTMSRSRREVNLSTYPLAIRMAALQMAPYQAPSPSPTPGSPRLTWHLLGVGSQVLHVHGLREEAQHCELRVQPQSHPHCRPEVARFAGRFDQASAKTMSCLPRATVGKRRLKGRLQRWLTLSPPRASPCSLGRQALLHRHRGHRATRSRQVIFLDAAAAHIMRTLSRRDLSSLINTAGLLQM